MYTNSLSHSFNSPAYENYVKELKNNGFEKDMRIYNLEEQLKNLEAKYTDLQCSHNELEAKVLHAESDRNRTVQCSDSSKKSANLHGFTVSKKSPVVETPIILSRVPAVGRRIRIFWKYSEVARIITNTVDSRYCKLAPAVKHCSIWRNFQIPGVSSLFSQRGLDA